MIGFIGGVLGALVATGVGYLVRGLVQQTFHINIPFVLDPLTIGGGVLIGLVVFLVAKLPVPERFNLRYLGLLLVGVAVSVLIALATCCWLSHCWALSWCCATNNRTQNAKRGGGFDTSG